MSPADLWPSFGQTDPPATGLWSTLRAFAGDLERRTNGRVLARLDAVKLPHVPLGKAFELRFAAAREPSRSVSMLLVIEQAEGLLLRGLGEQDVHARTEKDLVKSLEGFAASPRVAEIVRVLGGRDLA
jgi:hypothetical protein